MTAVALVGPDGAGKTTVGRRLAADPALKVDYMYLGVNPDASNRMLFTTRTIGWLKRRRGTTGDHGPPADAAEMFRTERPPSVAKELKSTLRVVNQIADEWYRQAIAELMQLRGFVVVFDRHYLADYSVHDMSAAAALPFHRRLHGFVLRHLFPGPDAIVMLDAPAEVLLDRKGEGTVDALERRRQDYLALRSTTEVFHVVDATQELADVYRDVAGFIAALGRR